jgi:hypothetical protein
MHNVEGIFDDFERLGKDGEDDGAQSQRSGG